jgi:hypothetical protein
VVGVNVQTGEEVAVKLVCDICSLLGLFVHDACFGLFIFSVSSGSCTCN